MGVENKPQIATYFADTASMPQLERMMGVPVFTGITTNPSSLAKEAGNIGVSPEEYCRDIAIRFSGKPVSVQLVDSNVEAAVKKAHELAALADNIVIKVPMFCLEIDDPKLIDELGNVLPKELEKWMKHISETEAAEGIQIIGWLSEAGLVTNVTALMTTQQAVLAMHAGIEGKKEVGYVSLFVNRIRDGAGDPQREISETREYIEKFGLATRIIGASIRSRQDVSNAEIWGAHIVTIPPDVFWQKLVWNAQTVRFTKEARKNFEQAFPKS